MTSCLVDNKMFLQLWDMYMRVMQRIWITGGPPQVTCSLQAKDLFVGSLWYSP